MCPRDIGPTQGETTEEESRESSLMDKLRKAKAAREAAKPAGEAAKPASLKPVVKTYVVQPGDTLGKIAKDQYGDASRWPEIHEANKEKIPDPNLIEVGQELRIP